MIVRSLLVHLLRLAWICSLVGGLATLAYGEQILGIILLWSTPNWMMATGMAKTSLWRHRRICAIREYWITHRECCDRRKVDSRWDEIVENYHTL